MTAPTTTRLSALDPDTPDTPDTSDSTPDGAARHDTAAASPPADGTPGSGDHGGGDGSSPTGSGESGTPQAPNRFGLSLHQVAGTTLASATSAYAASRLGLAGTLIGAAVGSLIITVGSAVYTHSFRSAHARLRATSRVGRMIVLVTGLVLAIALITVVELVVGHPLGNPGESGTTVTRVVAGDTGAHPSSVRQSTVPASEPTPTVTVTATATVTSSPSATDTATPTGTATAPSATDTATPTGTATTPAATGTATATATASGTATASATTPVP